MAWLPMMKIPHQAFDANGDLYLNAVLKAYAAGTSTNINMATDYTGGTTVGSVAINAAGYATVSGNVIIPHIDQSYKIALFPTQADADADNFAGALFTIDNINPGITSAEIFYAETTGASNAYVASISNLLTMTTGNGFMLKMNHNNSGASTLTVNGLAAKTFKKNATEDVESGDFTANAYIFCVYDGTYLQVIGGLPEKFKVKCSSNDTTESYLEDKIAAGTGISKTTTNDGGNETVQVSVDQDTLDGIVKAWVMFDSHTSTLEIKDSYNVNSVTHSSAGNYIVNYDAMADANYAVFMSADTYQPGYIGKSDLYHGPTYSTTQTSFKSAYQNVSGASTVDDTYHVSFCLMRK